MYVGGVSSVVGCCGVRDGSGGRRTFFCGGTGVRSCFVYELYQLISVAFPIGYGGCQYIPDSRRTVLRNAKVEVNKKARPCSVRLRIEWSISGTFGAVMGGVRMVTFVVCIASCTVCVMGIG